MAKILLVDDEPEIVVLTRMILEKEGHEVVVARNGAECFNRLKTETPDLILLDIMMPDDNGWEICKKIKMDKQTRGIPVAMFTVRTSDDSVEKSMEYSNANAHINKPFDMKKLLCTIEKILEEASL